MKVFLRVAEILKVSLKRLGLLFYMFYKWDLNTRLSWMTRQMPCRKISAS